MEIFNFLRKYYDLNNRLYFCNILVTNTVNTRSDHCCLLTSLPGDIVAITTEEYDEWILTLYNMRTESEIYSEVLGTVPTGLAFITLGGKPALVISYG